MLAKLKRINELRDAGEISAQEAQERKYKLVKEEDEKHKQEEVFDKSCTT